jgi:hypothetical protein
MGGGAGRRAPGAGRRSPVLFLRSVGSGQGAAEKKWRKKTMYVRTLFGLDLFLDARCRDFFIVFLSSSYRETPKNAIKKKSVRGGGGLDARPRKTFFITFLSSPYREALNQRN